MRRNKLSRRDFIAGSCLYTCEMLAGPSRCRASEDSFEAAVLHAGNIDSDQERLDYLRKLQGRSGLDASIRQDLGKLISQIDRWLHDKQLDYFGSQIRKNNDYDFDISESSAIAPLTWLYRGRMVIWYAMESGSIWSISENRRAPFAAARGFFEKYTKAFPQNKIARMYLGQPTGPYKQYEAAPGAPAWAVYQREGLERLADIIEWWIDNRMQEDGQYGGGWGDDCEMWRWWVPVLIGFDSPKISDAQARFSAALMNQPHMKQGYTTRMSDVEHTAEDSADAVTPMMHIDPENDIWRRYALRPAELMEHLWTARNERGFLQFKSTYFTADKIDTSPQRACDTVYHPRVVQAALLYWQRTADPRLTKLFSAWMDTWVDAAERAERSKPAGIIPTAIHWPDGQVGGLGPDWWDPRNHGEYTLYLYPSAMSLMTHTLLLTHYMTGQARYLAPIRATAGMRLKYLIAPPSTEFAPGTEGWCAARLGDLSSVITKYRFLTGSTEFDELLRKEMSPYMRLRLHGDAKSLEAALKQNAEALRMNFEGYTNEVRYTDRVLRFPALFASDGILGRSVESIHSPDTSLLYSMVTGDPGDAGYFPLNAVRWLTPPREIAALITESGRSLLSAELFSFGSQKRSMAAEFFLLDPGDYRLTVCVGSQPVASVEFAVKARRTRVDFDLPPHTLCTLQVRPH